MRYNQGMVKDSALLDRVLEPLQRNMSEEIARAIMSLEFSARDQKRYQTLAIKANRGTIKRNEQSELDRFLAVNDFLTLLRAEAHTVLNRKSSAA
jgi:hypothetical protein